MLKGQKVNLRLMRESDLDDYIRYSHDLDVRGPFFPMRIETELTIRKQWSETGFWSDDLRMMLIVDPTTDRMLGMIAAFPMLRFVDCLEVGYILHDTTRRGEGITPDALRTFVGYLFRLKNIFRIHLLAQTGNVASRRTAEKAGFTHEGTMRQMIVQAGKPEDLEMYSILRAEFEALEASQ